MKSRKTHQYQFDFYNEGLNAHLLKEEERLRTFEQRRSEISIQHGINCNLLSESTDGKWYVGNVSLKDYLELYSDNDNRDMYQKSK